MNSKEIVQYVRQFFPITPTKEIAKHTGLSEYQVRTIAKKNHVKKCEEYMKWLKADLVTHRRNWYEENIPSCEPTHYQEQLLYGSVLGDGYI